MKLNYLEELKNQYYNELINKRKIFNQEKKRDEVKGNTTVFDDQISKLKGNLQEISNIINIKLNAANKEMKEFNKEKVKYNKIATKYRKYVDTLIYGSSNKSSKKTKKSFSYKMNLIINIKQSADVSDETSKEYKNYKKCQEKYDRAIETYTSIKSRIGENLYKGETLNNDIAFINAFITRAGKDHEKNIIKFQDNWETETDKFYKELSKLVPEKSIDSITGANDSINSINYKSGIEKVEKKLNRIYDIFNQVNETVLQINVVRVLEHVKKFILGVKETHTGIMKDLKLMKKDFLNLKSASILKSMCNHIVRAHLQNTKLLVCVKYYFDNIETEEAIKLFTTTNIYKNSDYQKRLGLLDGLGTSTPNQNVFGKQATVASQAGPILKNPNIPTIVGGGERENTIMKGGDIDNILLKDKQFKNNKKELENLIKNINSDFINQNNNIKTVLTEFNNITNEVKTFTSNLSNNTYEEDYDKIIKINKELEDISSKIEESKEKKESETKLKTKVEADISKLEAEIKTLSSDKKKEKEKEKEKKEKEKEKTKKQKQIKEIETSIQNDELQKNIKTKEKEQQIEAIAKKLLNDNNDTIFNESEFNEAKQKELMEKYNEIFEKLLNEKKKYYLQTLYIYKIFEDINDINDEELKSKITENQNKFDYSSVYLLYNDIFDDIKNKMNKEENFENNKNIIKENIENRLKKIKQIYFNVNNENDKMNDALIFFNEMIKVDNFE